MITKNIQNLLEINDTLWYTDASNNQLWIITELFEGGFTAKDEYEIKDFYFDKLQNGWDLTNKTLQRITLNPENIPHIVETSAIIIAPKGLTKQDKESIDGEKNLIFYFNDGCDYTIIIERDEDFEEECVAYYGDGVNRAKSKTFNKPTFEENKKWAINWGKKVANDILTRGYN